MTDMYYHHVEQSPLTPGWHFIPVTKEGRMYLNHTGQPVKLGVPTYFPKIWPYHGIEMCSRGLHSCERVDDSLYYAASIDDKLLALTRTVSWGRGVYQITDHVMKSVHEARMPVGIYWLQEQDYEHMVRSVKKYVAWQAHQDGEGLVKSLLRPPREADWDDGRQRHSLRIHTGMALQRLVLREQDVLRLYHTFTVNHVVESILLVIDGVLDALDYASIPGIYTDDEWNLFGRLQAGVSFLKMMQHPHGKWVQALWAAVHDDVSPHYVKGFAHTVGRYLQDSMTWAEGWDAKRVAAIERRYCEWLDRDAAATNLKRLWRIYGYSGGAT